MLLTSTPATIGPAVLTMTAVGPRPHTVEPTLGLVSVGICTTGPTPHVQPPGVFRGEKNAEASVGAIAWGTLSAG